MIYFLRLPTGSIKIGYTGDLDARMKQLRRHYGCDFKIVATMPGGVSEEHELHQRFAHLRFDRTEQFRPGPDLAEFIGRLLIAGSGGQPVRLKKPLKERTKLVPRKGEPFATREKPFARLTGSLKRAISDGFFVTHAGLPNAAAPRPELLVDWHHSIRNAFEEHCEASDIPCIQIVCDHYRDDIWLWTDIRRFNLSRFLIKVARAVGSRWSFCDDGFFFIWSVPPELTAWAVKEIQRRSACPAAT